VLAFILDELAVQFHQSWQIIKRGHAVAHA